MWSGAKIWKREYAIEKRIVFRKNRYVQCAWDIVPGVGSAPLESAGGVVYTKVRGDCGKKWGPQIEGREFF